MVRVTVKRDADRILAKNDIEKHKKKGRGRRK